MAANENKLIIAILIGAIAGILCGILFGSSMVSVVWIGDLFLDALKMMIVPLIVAAVITGVTSLGDIENSVKSAVLHYCTMHQQRLLLF